jgi:hypothetical protein
MRHIITRLCIALLWCSLCISLSSKLMEKLQRPSWLSAIAASPGVTRLDVKEWDDEVWRQDSSESGFKGLDFIHSAQSAVQIQEYLLVDTKDASCSYRLGSCGKLPPPLEGYPILVGSLCTLAHEANLTEGSVTVARSVPSRMISLVSIASRGCTIDRCTC